MRRRSKAGVGRQPHEARALPAPIQGGCGAAAPRGAGCGAFAERRICPRRSKAGVGRQPHEARDAARLWSAASMSADVMQARDAARLWSAASISAGDSAMQQARDAARLWSAASISAGDSAMQQARDAARLWSAASMSAGLCGLFHACVRFAVRGGCSCASVGDFGAGVWAGLGGSPAGRGCRSRPVRSRSGRQPGEHGGSRAIAPWVG